jgi:two-component system alkaline phosphatase synthesis response regulator PhoP
MKRILAIDDEQDVTDLIKLQLESMGGFVVDTENEGAGALMTARETSPDLILLDIMMPDVDGSELAAQMLEDPLLKDTPVIFLTALVSTEEISNGNLGTGPRRYFPKPINFKKLVDAIHETLGNNVSS